MNIYSITTCLLLTFLVTTAHSQSATIATDSIELKLTITTPEGLPIKTKVVFENILNHKKLSAYTNAEGRTERILPAEAGYKITIPGSEDSYEYEIPEFIISPVSLLFKFNITSGNK